MKIYVYPADLFGCGHYRLIWPGWAAAAMAAGDVEVEVISPQDSSRQLAAVTNKHGDVTEVMMPRDADGLVIQRPTHPQLLEGIPIIRRRGVAVIIDMDDDLTAIHPSNPAWLAMHPRSAVINGQRVQNTWSWQNVTAACRAATLVTVSTPPLVRKYRGALESVILENCIPRGFLDVPHTDSKVIGWAGSVPTHPTDLKPLGPTIRILGERGAQFMVVGNGEGAAQQLNLRGDPPYTGPIDFDKWISAVTQIGIGVAPLAESKFNDAKSWLKPLEYSVAGVPWVASPRPEYARFHDMGAGLLANRPRDWQKVLSRVLGSSDLRVELSGQGRSVAANWTVEEHAHRWLDAWTSAVRFERERSVRMTTAGGSRGTAPARN